MKTLCYTLVAIIAFAANSVICRYALVGNMIDAASFTAIRLFSGAITLCVLVALKERGINKVNSGSYAISLYLFVYAITFSYAYIALGAGVGALILFAAVQLTMVIVSLVKGNMLSKYEWFGIALAFSGLSYLLLPSASAPPLFAALLMTVAGISWGLYTLAGKETQQPLISTTIHFVRTLPFVVLLYLCTFDHHRVSESGLLLAILSGVCASGLGYAVWYLALQRLTVIQAAVIQLIVPIVAIFAGSLWLGEIISVQLVVSACMVLGGILISSINKAKI